MIKTFNFNFTEGFSLDIPRTPFGKQRVRPAGRGGILYTPKETVSYEDFVRFLFREKYPDRLPYDRKTPLICFIESYFPIPLSLRKKEREALEWGFFYPTKKPDLDNIYKATTDALNKIAYMDDCDFIDTVIQKRYAELVRVKFCVGVLPTF